MGDLATLRGCGKIQAFDFTPWGPQQYRLRDTDTVGIQNPAWYTRGLSVREYKVLGVMQDL